MPFTAENVVQVVMGYRLAGEIVENVYHVHKGSTWSLTDLGSLVATFLSWETDTASLLRSNEVDLVRITATDLTNLTAGRVDDQLTAPVVGGVASGALPANATFAIKASIGERGKGRNGRTFWIGLAEDQVSGATIATATADDIQAALNTLLTDIATAIAGAAMCVIHTRAGGVPLTVATFTVIQNWVYTDTLVDSQRDRLPGHKRHKKKVITP